MVVQIPNIKSNDVELIVDYLMRKISLLFLACLLASLACCQSDIFSQYYQQCRKIAEAMTQEQLAGQTIQADFDAITNQERQTTSPQQAVTLHLGSLLISGTAAPTDNGNIAKIPSILEYEKHLEAFSKGTVENWKKLIDRFTNLGVSVSTKDSGKYKIKFLLGTDAVHGDQHTIGTILFPHNIGLSCSHNPDNFQNVGYWTRQAMKKTGFNYAFAPTVAVSHNPQWGRFYETMGQDDNLIEQYAQAYTKGLQDVSNGKINGVLGSVKHFFGDGSTLYGCNMGSANVLNFKNFIDHNIKGYVGSTKSNIGSVMASYSAINWIPNAINGQYLMGLLREDVGFNGFTISDYDDLKLMTQMLMPRTFMNFTAEEEAYAAMVNGGIDMFMVHHKASVQRVFKHAKKTTQRHYVPKVRLVQAATRILTVKMAMGLIEKVTLNENGEEQLVPIVETQTNSAPPSTSSGNQYQDSLNAVRQSLVLLKNDNGLLPSTNLRSTIKYVVLVGQKIHNINHLTKIQLFRQFDDIGMQCGGWTVRWQGVLGNQYWPADVKAKINASSILDALKLIQKQNNFSILYANYSSLTSELSINNERTKFISDLKAKKIDMNSRNTLIIGTFGQIPYAESTGDVNIPYCQTEDRKGCLYNTGQNAYAPGAQYKTLNVEISKYDKEVVSAVREADQRIPLISVLLSGRPMIVEELLSLSTATIAAWLPGTSGGQGIVDAIVGDYIIKPKNDPKKNTLSVDWPKDMSQLGNFPNYETDGTLPRLNQRLFSVGDGLSTQFGTEIEDLEEISEQNSKDIQTPVIAVINEHEGIMTAENDGN